MNMMTAPEVREKKLRLTMSSADFRGIVDALKVGVLTLVPEDLSQRSIIRRLIPDLYVLRKQGYSFKQLCILLNSFGMRLSSPALLRTYYADFQIECMEACDKKLQQTFDIIEHIETRERFEGKDDIVQRAMNTSKKLPVNRNIGANVFQNISPIALPPPLSKTATPESPGTGDSGQKQNQKQTGGAPPVTPPAPKCMAIASGEKPLNKKTGIMDIVLANDVYESDKLMEHPAIPGLQLTKEQRLYGGMLEISDEAGEITTETIQQKMFRVKWRKPLTPVKSDTEGDFMKLDTDLFPKT